MPAEGPSELVRAALAHQPRRKNSSATATTTATTRWISKSLSLLTEKSQWQMHGGDSRSAEGRDKATGSDRPSRGKEAIAAPKRALMHNDAAVPTRLGSIHAGQHKLLLFFEIEKKRGCRCTSLVATLPLARSLFKNITYHYI